MVASILQRNQDRAKETKHDFRFYRNKGTKKEMYADGFRYACFLMSTLNHQGQTQISTRNRAKWHKNGKVQSTW